MKKRTLSLILAVAMLCSLITPAFANYPVNLDVLYRDISLSTYSASQLSQEFSQMTDDEFDRTIAVLARDATDHEILKENLGRCGVSLESVTSEKYYNPLSRTLDDSQAEIILAVSKRGGEDYYHVVACLDFTWAEAYPTTQDGVTLYFDATKAQYRNYNEGNGFRLKSGIQATNGTLVFNFDDSLLTLDGYDGDFYGAVYITPYGSDPVVYGADYAHTYGDVDFNITGGSVGFSYGPVVSGSVTVNFSIIYDDENMWQIAAIDSF